MVLWVQSFPGFACRDYVFRAEVDARVCQGPGAHEEVGRAHGGLSGIGTKLASPGLPVLV